MQLRELKSVCVTAEVRRMSKAAVFPVPGMYRDSALQESTIWVEEKAS